MGTLNGPTDRNLAHLTKTIKTLQPSPLPLVTQKGQNTPNQSPQPVTLAGSGKIWRPSTSLQSVNQTRTDGGDGGLKPTPVRLGPQSENPPTVPTTVPSKPKGLVEPIKVGRTKPMAPKPSTTLRTPFELGPRKSSTQFKDPLDTNINKEYQWTSFCGFYPFVWGKGRCQTLCPNPS